MKFARRALDLGELTAIIERAQLGADEREKLVGAVETLALLTRELEAKGASIDRLRKLLFGASTEKTDKIFCSARRRKQRFAWGNGCRHRFGWG